MSWFAKFNPFTGYGVNARAANNYKYTHCPEWDAQMLMNYQTAHDNWVQVRNIVRSHGNLEDNHAHARLEPKKPYLSTDISEDDFFQWFNANKPLGRFPNIDRYFGQPWFPDPSFLRGTSQGE